MSEHQARYKDGILYIDGLEIPAEAEISAFLFLAGDSGLVELHSNIAEMYLYLSEENYIGLRKSGALNPKIWVPNNVA